MFADSAGLIVGVSAAIDSAVDLMQGWGESCLTAAVFKPLIRGLEL